MGESRWNFGASSKPGKRKTKRLVSEATEEFRVKKPNKN
jgi:hypothetical protein